MDLDKIVSFASEHVARYVFTLTAVISAPRSRFEHHVPSVDKLSDIATPASGSASPAMLNSTLVVFATISIALGSTINALIPERGAVAALPSTFAVLSVIWLLYGTLAHLICRLMGGD